MHTDTLSWIKNHKYYKLLFHPTLIGITSIVLIWGRIGSNLGSSKIILCETKEEVEKIISETSKRRKSRGYKQET